MFWITSGIPERINLKWLNKFLTSMHPYLHTKNHIYDSNHSWDQADPTFGISLGMSRHAWTHPLEMAG